MKRSEINAIIRENIAFLQSQNFVLPPFAFFSPAEWAEKGHEYDEIRDNALGWDITDFGAGDYAHLGLFLFTVRNGNQKLSDRYPKPYAEKIMIVGEGQVTPFHYHWFKMEDIINRGGGTLVITLYNADKDTDLLDMTTPVTVHSDGRVYDVPAGTSIRLAPGESVTLHPGQYHRFVAEGAKCMVAEVSQCNDDANDNRFLEPTGRFPAIEEDEPAAYLLCTEYPAAKDEPAKGTKKKAVAAGHICLDITPVFPKGTDPVGSLAALLRPGKLVRMDAPDVHPGGSVANTGIGMKIMGADVRLVGKVGKDDFGALVERCLREYGAGGSLIRDASVATGYSVIFAPPGLDRVILHCSGANDTFDGREIDDKMLEDAALFHFGYPSVMRCLYEDGGEALAALMKRVHEKGIATSLDMAAVDPASDAAKADWPAILAACLPHVDFFCPSLEELCFMLDKERHAALFAHGEPSAKDASAAASALADRCLALGARAALIKCGAPGLFLKTAADLSAVGEKIELDKAVWQSFAAFEKSYSAGEVLSATGAGDTCIAAFLCSLLEGAAPKEACENAAAAGALCCTAYDAISGLEPLSAIRARIDAGLPKAE